jgi:hypothetical protein
MRLLFQKSFETNALVKLFVEQIAVGQTVTFGEASARVGFPVTSRLPAYQSAKSIARRDHGVVIGPAKGVGFSRLNGENIVKRGGYIMKGIRGRAQVGAAEAEIALTHNLDRNAQLTASQNLTRFRLAADIATPPKTNRQIVPPPDLITRTAAQ